MTARTPLVSTAELAARLGDPSLVVLDCRHDLVQPHAGRAAWAAGHIPGARFVGLDDDLAGPRTGRNGRHPLPDPDAAAACFGALGIDASRQVVAYDAQSMANAARVWWTLRWLGHDAVVVLDGGWNAWVAEGRPVTDAAPPVPPARFVARPDPALAVDAAFITARLRAPGMTLVDARSAERYRGEKEPIDPVAGHIPGALNRFVGENLAADGRFRAPDELRRGWSALLGARAPETLVHSCGSGVAACQNMLSLAVAGLPTGRLYPGSWSEWIADPARPRATGAEP